MAELKTGYKKGRTRNKKWKISVRFRHQRIKLLKAKNLKYIHANKDNSNENNISPQEMYEKAQTGYAAAKQTSGVIYTAAGRAGKNAGEYSAR